MSSHVFTFTDAITKALVLLADPATTDRALWGDILHSILNSGSYQNGWARDVPAAKEAVISACLDMPRP